MDNLPATSAGLDEFSKDILLEIISRLDYRSEDLASLSIACRRLNVLCAPSLLDCKENGSIDLGIVDSLGLDCQPFRCFLQRPQLWYYGRKVEVRFQKFRHFTMDYHGYVHVKSDFRDSLTAAEERDLWETAIAKLGLLGWEDGEDMVQALHDGDPSARVALALLMHRNMKILLIEFDDLEEHFLDVGNWVSWAVNQVSSRSRLHHFRASSYGFHALHTLSLVGSRKSLRHSLCNFSRFFSLPSIRTISAWDLNDRVDLAWNGEFGVSTVVNLNLFSCDITYASFETLLRIPRALQSICFVYGGPEPGFGKGFYNELVDIVERTTNLDMAHVNIDFAIKSYKFNKFNGSGIFDRRAKMLNMLEVARVMTAYSPATGWEPSLPEDEISMIPSSEAMEWIPVHSPTPEQIENMAQLRRRVLEERIQDAKRMDDMKRRFLDERKEGVKPSKTIMREYFESKRKLILEAQNRWNWRRFARRGHRKRHRTHRDAPKLLCRGCDKIITTDR